VTEHSIPSHQHSVPDRPADTADVIIVGAGPAGSTTAYYLAQAGLDVLLLEKSRFPREKVCGDGLTPRAVKALVGMGISVGEEDGWVRNKGLRVIGAGKRMELCWPELASYPGYGLVRGRTDLDQTLARRAEKVGARLQEGVTVTGPVLDEATGRITGVTARPAGEGTERAYHARVVVAADGNSSRLSVAMGLRKRDDRPLGVAVRTYYKTPRHDDDYLESWLDLWDGDRLLPGYGWIFGMGDGTSNVGLGLLNTSAAFGNTDYHALLRRWLNGMPAEWGFTEENRTQPIRGAADGLQQDPVLLQRAAAGRRRRRHGEPVQRRGDRLRDGIGRDPGEDHRPGAGQGAAGGDGTRARRVSAGARRRLRRLLRRRPPVREADRPAGADALRDQAQHVAPGPDGVRAQAARQPDRSAWRCGRPAGQRPVQTRTKP
jgi:geranylgeranyl reductase family protein